MIECSVCGTRLDFFKLRDTLAIVPCAHCIERAQDRGYDERAIEEAAEKVKVAM